MSYRLAHAILNPRDRDVLLLFADELAKRLGRPAEEIRARGLSAGDFAAHRVEVVFSDESRMTFQYAFFVVSPERGLLGIFTEHCRYHCVGLANIDVQELDGKRVVAAWKPQPE